MPDDLEDLSALFDGELDGDAARFTRKRLGHDSEWQQACGRWQLIGDALRGQATAAAPAGFAARVTAAVAQEPTPVFVPDLSPIPRVQPRGRSRLWLGSALAASMALVAVFVTRPPSIAPGAQMPVAQTVPAGQGAAPAIAVAAPVVDEAAPQIAAVPDDEPRVAPQAVAEPSTPMRPLRSRATELAARQSTTRIARSVQQRAAGLDEVNDLPRVAVAEATPDPFRPSDEIATRPWPRAVLPNSQAAGALTASFGAQATGSRSFYPFEPQEPAEPVVAPVRQP
ncbi:RseA family anti-sigma factor [Lysobacter korlensis]